MDDEALMAEAQRSELKQFRQENFGEFQRNSMIFNDFQWVLLEFYGFHLYFIEFHVEKRRISSAGEPSRGLGDHGGRLCALDALGQLRMPALRL